MLGKYLVRDCNLPCIKDIQLTLLLGKRDAKFPTASSMETNICVFVIYTMLRVVACFAVDGGGGRGQEVICRENKYFLYIRFAK